MANNSDSGLSELDKCIHNFEFENQQLVKMIEKENQCINGLNVQIQTKKDEARRMDEEIHQWDHEIKRLHRQLTSNRETINNLKSTRSVMMDHEQALSKQLERLKLETAEKKKFYKQHEENYKATREEHIKKYKTFPLAVKLEKIQNLAEEKRSELSKIETLRDELNKKIESKQKVHDSQDLTKIVVKFATAKVECLKLEKQIEAREIEIERYKQQMSIGHERSCMDVDQGNTHFDQRPATIASHATTENLADMSMEDSNRCAESIDAKGFDVNKIDATFGGARCMETEDLEENEESSSNNRSFLIGCQKSGGDNSKVTINNSRQTPPVTVSRTSQIRPSVTLPRPPSSLASSKTVSKPGNKEPQATVPQSSGAPPFILKKNSTGGSMRPVAPVQSSTSRSSSQQSGAPIFILKNNTNTATTVAHPLQRNSKTTVASSLSTRPRSASEQRKNENSVSQSPQPSRAPTFLLKNNTSQVRKAPSLSAKPAAPIPRTPTFSPRNNIAQSTPTLPQAYKPSAPVVKPPASPSVPQSHRAPTFVLRNNAADASRNMSPALPAENRNLNTSLSKPITSPRTPAPTVPVKQNCSTPLKPTGQIPASPARHGKTATVKLMTPSGDAGFSSGKRNDIPNKTTHKTGLKEQYETNEKVVQDDFKREDAKRKEMSQPMFKPATMKHESTVSKKENKNHPEDSSVDEEFEFNNFGQPLTPETENSQVTSPPGFDFGSLDDTTNSNSPGGFSFSFSNFGQGSNDASSPGEPEGGESGMSFFGDIGKSQGSSDAQTGFLNFCGNNDEENSEGGGSFMMNFSNNDNDESNNDNNGGFFF